MSVYDANGNVLTRVYDASGNELSIAYDSNGNIIYRKDQSDPMYDYDDYTISSLFNLTGTSYQGFAVHNGVIAQFQSDDKVSLVSVTGETIASQMYCKSYHGQSAFFTDEYYQQGDEFPLLVVLGSYTNQWVNRITRSGTSLVKTLYIPTTVEYGGYKLASAYDPTTKKMYMFGYTTSNYNSDEGGTNKLILSTWDYSNLIDNGDDTYTPTLLSVVQRDFVKCVQGSDYYDGLLWVTSTNGQSVYAFDPLTAEIKHTITLGGSEVEGCAWVGNEYLLVGQSPMNITYKKVTFAEVSEEETPLPTPVTPPTEDA